MARRQADTPMMQQYAALKRQAGDALLFYRMGDFYELFGDDARDAAPLLDLMLTTRDKDAPDPTPMCGLPFHALEGYLRRVLKTGRSVAIAEQVEDPRLARGLVKREIVEVVTPGLVSNPERLEDARANYLAAVISEQERYGLAYVDVSTGEFGATDTGERGVHQAELDRLAPREIVARSGEGELPSDVRVRRVPDADFDLRAVSERLGRLPAGLADGDSTLAARAAAALCATVAALQPGALEQLRSVRRYAASDRLLLDAPTRAHLELFRSLRDGGRRGTLIELLDQTRTPLGRRRLERWLGEPLVDLQAIRERQERVAAWIEPDSRRRALAEALRRVGDLERALARVSLASSGPREFAALRAGLEGVGGVHEIAPLTDALSDCHAELRRVIVDAPGPAPRGEPYVGYVRGGVDGDLDAVRAEAREGDEFLGGLEARERSRLGIPSLKLRYNRVFGYSIEVTKSHLDKVPAEYTRKQTTAGGERFTTDELQRWEGVVLRERERAAALEARVLERLRAYVRAEAERLRATADAIAELDVAQSLAEVARERDFVRPEVDDSLRIEIDAGRHPVVEAFTPAGFVANDVVLDAEDARFLILTGPNMSGKSTLLRQVALIVLLAQAGSFVPARRARIGVADRIFTRVGASDSITTGESTFMTEMRETATILSEATPRSLVVLDEIGRGTSTFDGLSIAWAVAETLHDLPGLRPRVLFATHYHELADLARTKQAVRNYHFACAESDDEVLFLRRMEPGAASRSYGIEVARVAGLPPDTIRRAREILANLEGGEFDDRGTPRLAREAVSGAGQLSLFHATADPLRAELRRLEPERMTPLDALVEVARLRALAEEDL